MLPVYAELYCRSNFSFQQGASKPEELLRSAYTLGYRAIAITDECSLAGSVRAYQEWRVLCKAELELGRKPSLQLITGACFCIDEHALILLAQTRHGYATLTRFITQARQRTHKGEYAVALHELADVSQCHAIIIPGENATALLNATAHLPRTLGYSRLLVNNDAPGFTHTLALAQAHQLRITACGDVLTHDKARQPLQDILTAVRHGTTVDELGALAQRNAERVLRPINALSHLYPSELMIESAQIADTCGFTLDELRYEYPDEVVPPGHTATSYLAQQTWLGAKRRYHGRIPTKVEKLINKELKLITEVKYEAYF